MKELRRIIKMLCEMNGLSMHDHIESVIDMVGPGDVEHFKRPFSDRTETAAGQDRAKYDVLQGQAKDVLDAMMAAARSKEDVDRERVLALARDFDKATVGEGMGKRMGKRQGQHPDSQVGALAFAKSFFEPGLITDEAIAIPDPQVQHVWLLMDPSSEFAAILYLHDDDAEEVDFDEAVSKYGPYELKGEGTIRPGPRDHETMLGPGPGMTARFHDDGTVDIILPGGERYKTMTREEYDEMVQSDLGAMKATEGVLREYPSMDAGGPADFGDWVKDSPEDHGKMPYEEEPFSFEDLSEWERSELAYGMGYDGDSDPGDIMRYLQDTIAEVSREFHPYEGEFGDHEKEEWWFVDTKDGEQYVSGDGGETWNTTSRHTLKREGALNEYEYYVDEDGYATDDEGNREYVGTSHGSGTYGASNGPAGYTSYRRGGGYRRPSSPRTSAPRQDNRGQVKALQTALEKKNSGFLKSVLQQASAGRTLSVKQRAVIKKILFGMGMELEAGLFETASPVILTLGQLRSLLRESMSRHCDYYMASDEKWYMELAHDEHGEWHEATTYGPFSSMDAVDSYLNANFSNPGGMGIDDSGSREPPTESPNGQPVVNPSRGGGGRFGSFSMGLHR